MFAWDPNAWNGKGYWFVLGTNGGLGRAASKKEASALKNPDKEPTKSKLPRQNSLNKREIGDKMKENAGQLKKKFEPSKVAKGVTGTKESKPNSSQQNPQAEQKPPRSNVPQAMSGGAVNGVSSGNALINALNLLYELIKNNLDSEKKQKEIQKNFEEEKLAEANKTAKAKEKDVKDIEKVKKKPKAEKVKEEPAKKPAEKVKPEAAKTEAAKAPKVEAAKTPKVEAAKTPKVEAAKTPSVPKPSATSVKPPASTGAPSVPSAGTLAKVAVGTTAAVGAAVVGYDGIKGMIAKHEGAIPYPYKDSKGLWTIGVGHLIGNGKSLPPQYDAYKNNGGPYDKKNNTTPALSKEEMDKLFDEDFKKHYDIAKKGPGFDKANEAAQGAFIDLSYNMGAWWTIFKQAAKSAEAGDFEKTADQLTDSKWYNQVGKRAVTVVGLIRNGGKAQAQATSMPVQTGSKVESASTENKDLKSQQKQAQATVIVNNTTNNVKQGDNKTVATGGPTNDNPPYQQVM